MRIQDHFDGVAVYRLGFVVNLRACWSVDGSVFLNTLFEIGWEPFHVLVNVNLPTNLFGTLPRNGAILVIDELIDDLQIRIKFRIEI